MGVKNSVGKGWTCFNWRYRALLAESTRDGLDGRRHGDGESGPGRVGVRGRQGRTVQREAEGREGVLSSIQQGKAQGEGEGGLPRAKTRCS